MTAVLLGLLAGVVLGSLGGGGAIVTVPILVYLLGQDARVATTESLVIVGVSSLAAALSHARAGAVRWTEGLAFGAVGIAGTWVGSWAATNVSGDRLLLLFAILLLTVAVVMFQRARATRTAEEPDAAEVASSGGSTQGLRLPRGAELVKIVAVATAVGLLTGFFGVGGGFVIVPALVVLLRYPMPVAVGTSLFVIALNSASALVSRLGHGVAVDWRLVGLFTGGAILGALVGSRASRRVPAHVLTTAFGVLLVLVAAYTAIRSAIALA